MNWFKVAASLPLWAIWLIKILLKIAWEMLNKYVFGKLFSSKK